LACADEASHPISIARYPFFFALVVRQKSNENKQKSKRKRKKKQNMYSAVQKKVVQKVLTIPFYSVLSDCVGG
jgi:predicted solute-binding protein